jgi:hypothetical protein
LKNGNIKKLSMAYIVPLITINQHIIPINPKSTLAKWLISRRMSAINHIITTGGICCSTFCSTIAIGLTISKIKDKT